MSKKNRPRIIETPIGEEILTDDGLMAIEDLVRLTEFYKPVGATHLSIDRYYVEDEEGIEHRKFSFQFVKRISDERK